MMTAAPGSLQQRVIDVMALTGDQVDNVPGCLGIGPRTAAKLINRWGSLDALLISAVTGYANDVLTPRIAQLLKANVEKILVSRELVRLDRGFPPVRPKEE